MGKKRLQRIKEGSEERPKDGRIRAWLGKARDKYDEKVNTALDNATAEAHKKYYKRWMEYSGCHHPNLIHWEDPQISLEAKLCDPRNLRLIKKGRHRDEFFSICTDEEIDIYLNWSDADGNKYTDLEDGGVLKGIISGVKQKWRESKKKLGQDLTPEEEAQLDAMISDDEDED